VYRKERTTRNTYLENDFKFRKKAEVRHARALCTRFSEENGLWLREKWTYWDKMGIVGKLRLQEYFSCCIPPDLTVIYRSNFLLKI
jgi:hypothetical protein